MCSSETELVSIGMWIFYHVLGKQQIGHAAFSENREENQNGQSVFVALSVYIMIGDMDGVLTFEPASKINPQTNEMFAG